MHIYIYHKSIYFSEPNRTHRAPGPGAEACTTNCIDGKTYCFEVLRAIDIVTSLQVSTELEFVFLINGIFITFGAAPPISERFHISFIQMLIIHIYICIYIYIEREI